ncbi:MAG: hypothetical protein M0Z31_08015 [Clostridia bacterium]|nr:hypothetical protein [Clostridia bacterium]
MKDVGIFLMLILASVFICWLVIIKSSVWRGSAAKTLGLVAVLGLVNGAFFAGLITLVDLVKYHY